MLEEVELEGIQALFAKGLWIQIVQQGKASVRPGFSEPLRMFVVDRFTYGLQVFNEPFHLFRPKPILDRDWNRRQKSGFRKAIFRMGRMGGKGSKKIVPLARTAERIAKFLERFSDLGVRFSGAKGSRIDASAKEHQGSQRNGSSFNLGDLPRGGGEATPVALRASSVASLPRTRARIRAFSSIEGPSSPRSCKSRGEVLPM